MRRRGVLSLSLGGAASLSPFIPGMARTYDAGTTANVISTAGDAALSVADPSANATGRLVNGTFALPTPVSVEAASAGGTGGAFARVGAQLHRSGVQRRRDAVVQQAIGSSDALRTGSYSKTLTFTSSTTTP